MNKLRPTKAAVTVGACAFVSLPILETVIICNCSICTKKGIIHLIVPPERFELVCGKDDLTSYTFNTGVAKHTFCKHLRHPSIASTCLALPRPLSGGSGLAEHRRRPFTASEKALTQYFSDLVSSNADIPKLDVLFVGEFDEEASPLGAKGLGELTAVSVAPAIAIAVYYATGIRVRDLPITIEKPL